MSEHEHGTEYGAGRHRREGTPLCGPCKEAESARKAEYNITRHRALADLAEMYPTDYRRLLNKHRKALGMRIKRGVTKEMAMTQAEKVKARAMAWNSAARSLIAKHRAEFNELYKQEKAERGL